MNLLVRGGEVVSSGSRWRADVRVAGGRIVAVAASLEPEAADEVVDAAGLLVLPGIIDCHTHFQLDTGKMQTLDDFESGTASAAAGGVTTYINFAPQQRRQSLVRAIGAERAKADGHTLVDYSLHLSFGTPGDRWQEELSEVVAQGVTSAKIYTTYTDTIYHTRDWDWYRLMRVSGRAGLLVMVHAENDDILKGKTEELLASGLRSFRHHAEARPEVAEVEAVARGIAFCRQTGSPVYFVHLSCPASVDLVGRAAREGLPVLGEVCAHHISLQAGAYDTDQAFRYVMTPPLRSRAAMERLRSQVVGGLVDSMGSDHCGYALAQRGENADFTAASPGIPGVETLWLVLYTTLVAAGGMPVERAAELVTSRPADIFGLAPNKGRLDVGADGDLMLYDPSPGGELDESTLHSRAGYSPWHGLPVQGRVVRTVCRGRTVYRDGEVTGEASHGRFVRCAPFDPSRLALLRPRTAVAVR